MFGRKRDAGQERRRSGLGELLDVPSGVLEGFPQIALNGNTEAVIEGCRNVLEYENTQIRLNLGKLKVKFVGRNLEIRCMTTSNVVVGGTITGIEFTT